MEKGIKFFLFLCLYLVLSTEILSLFQCLNRIGVLTAWGIALILVSAYLYRTTHFHFSLKTKVLSLLKAGQALSLSERIVFFVLLVYVVLLGVAALIRPPFNFDSMTYHLAKCAYWIQNESVAPYAVMNDRQLVFAPFAEYAMTHLMLLTDSDVLVNFVQFAAYLLSGFLVYSICRFWDLPKQLSMLGSGIFWLIPMAILQSGTTQNDLVCTFFVLSAVYFGLKLTRKYGFTDLLAFSIAVACGMLTKGTFYFFVAPFLVWFGVKYLHSYRQGIFLIVCVPVLTVTLINAPFWSRNIVLYGHPLSGGKTFLTEYPDFVVERNRQKTLSFGNMVSVFSKNMYLHAQLPSSLSVADPLPFVLTLHRWIGVKTDDPAINPFGAQYYPVMIHEDVSGNIVSFYLLLLSMLLFFFVQSRKKVALYMTCLWAGYFLYAALTTYQPWATRLDLPFFALSVPIIVYVWQNCRFIKGKGAAGLLLLLLVLAFPYERAVVQPIFSMSSREAGYFLRAPQLYPVYRGIVREVHRLGINHLGLAMHEDAWEYPLFVMLKDTPGLEIRAVRIQPYYAKLAVRHPFTYQAVLTNDPMFLKQMAPLLADFIDLGEGFYFLIFQQPQNQYYKE